MQVLRPADIEVSVTPPVKCSSRNSMCDSNSRSGVKASMMPADSMEYINKILDKKKDSIKSVAGVKQGR